MTTSMIEQSFQFRLTSIVLACFALATCFTIFPNLIDAADQPGLIQSHFIFDPAPHPQCHASTIVETASGPVASWFGGTKEGNPDVGIWSSRHVNGSWQPAIEIANGTETEKSAVHCSNPVLFQIPNGPLTLFYKTGKWWAYTKR